MFKTINEFPNYEINESGEVRNKKTKRLLTHDIKKNGYHQIRMNKDGKQYARLIHRLVLITFNPVDNMENLEVNHIDENKGNNHLSNLEWCTSKYNANYGTRQKRCSINNPKTKPVVQYDIDGKLIAEYPSGRVAAQATGICQSGIRSAANGSRYTAGGYIWKYAI